MDSVLVGRCRGQPPHGQRARGPVPRTTAAWTARAWAGAADNNNTLAATLTRCRSCSEPTGFNSSTI